MLDLAYQSRALDFGEPRSLVGCQQESGVHTIASVVLGLVQGAIRRHQKPFRLDVAFLSTLPRGERQVRCALQALSQGFDPRSRAGSD